MHKLVYTKEAKKQIQRFDGAVKRQIETALFKLAQDPAAGKRLTGDLSSFLSYRSGDYRILYRILHHEIMVMIFSVGHRKGVYRKVKY